MKYKAPIIFFFSLVTGLLTLHASESDTTLFREPYRPQYHFTPAHRWIGDPCGLFKKDGKYMAYSWGAAETADLVHWK
ncbi:MAG: glycoside hydrolase family 32 protein, partial [Muribaculaceae bacterium]|nr:glycoside hydrolase family 32 protein [Muribaculaceae bacterium]